MEQKRAKNREAAKKCKEKKNQILHKMKSDFEAVQKRNSELKQERRLLKIKLDRIKLACMHYAPHMLHQFGHSQLAHIHSSQESTDHTYG